MADHLQRPLNQPAAGAVHRGAHHRGGSYFHIQPALELRLLTPDGSHLGQGVTLDHRRARSWDPQTL